MERTGHYPEFDRLGEESTYDRYHGYIKLDRDENMAAFPFGFGLSYTTFCHNQAMDSIQDDAVEVSVNVTNTGAVKGAQVIQLYIGSSSDEKDLIMESFVID